MPRKTTQFALAALICAALVLAFFTTGAAAQDPPCQEQEDTEPSPDGAQDLLELQPNAARPTFDVALKDKSSGSDLISFVPLGAARVGRTADIAAEITDIPRAETQRLGGQIFVAAHPNESGRRVVLEVCLESVPKFAAGRYEGTVSLFGPSLADFNYALVITTKWPWWSAVAIIAVAIIGFVIVAIVSNLVQFDLRDRRSAVANGLGLIVGMFLATVTYWSIYAKNDTWGDDPATQVTALIIASFSAGTAGLAAVRARLGPDAGAQRRRTPGRPDPDQTPDR